MTGARIKHSKCHRPAKRGAAKMHRVPGANNSTALYNNDFRLTQSAAAHGETSRDYGTPNPAVSGGSLGRRRLAVEVDENPSGQTSEADTGAKSGQTTGPNLATHRAMIVDQLHT